MLVHIFFYFGYDYENKEFEMLLKYIIIQAIKLLIIVKRKKEDNQNVELLHVETKTEAQNSDPVWNADFVLDVPDVTVNSLLVSLLDETKTVYVKEARLAEVPPSKIQIFNGKVIAKVINKIVEIGTLHYGFELCLGRPKNKTENKDKIFTSHSHFM